MSACLLLIGGGVAGCSTTQEKAEHQKARAEHILAARAARQKAKRKHEHGKGHKHDKGHGQGNGKNVKGEE